MKQRPTKGNTPKSRFSPSPKNAGKKGWPTQLWLNPNLPKYLKASDFDTSARLSSSTATDSSLLTFSSEMSVIYRTLQQLRSMADHIENSLNMMQGVIDGLKENMESQRDDSATMQCLRGRWKSANK